MSIEPEMLKSLLESHSGQKALRRGLHGLERETLRIDEKGNLMQTRHPSDWGDPLNNPFITTDFSESQPELITPPRPTISGAIQALKTVHGFAAQNLPTGEWLWPFSMPPRLPESEKIPIAQYGDSPAALEKQVYRRGLALRYGKRMQMLCGVHYNFSFSNELFELLGESLNMSDRKELKAKVYMHVVRNFIRHRWILVYLLGASPLADPSYRCPLMKASRRSHAISLRLSRCGYSNPSQIEVSYNDFPTHCQDLRRATETPYEPYEALGLEANGQRIQLNANLLQIANEYYFPIRLKPLVESGGFLEGLESTGVEYLEIRMIDVNPFVPWGVESHSLYLLHAFLVACLLEPSPDISQAEIKKAHVIQENLAASGQRKHSFERTAADHFFDTLEKVVPLLDESGDYKAAIRYYHESLDDPTRLPWKQVLHHAKDASVFTALGADLAKKHHSTLTSLPHVASLSDAGL